METSTIEFSLPRVNPSDETIGVGPLTVHFMISGENSGGTVAIFELVVPCGESLPIPAHSHDRYEETIYGVDGVLTWTVDGRQIDVGPGQVLCIRRGAIHRFDNNGSKNVKALCVITPAALGPEYFRECAAVICSQSHGSPEHAQLSNIMRRHGLTPV